MSAHWLPREYSREQAAELELQKVRRISTWSYVYEDLGGLPPRHGLDDENGGASVSSSSTTGMQAKIQPEQEVTEDLNSLNSAALPLACHVPETQQRPVLVTGDPDRAQAIFQTSKLWMNHEIIHYCFLEDTVQTGVNVSDEKKAIRKAFKTWKDTGIGLDFIEIQDADRAEIRIGFRNSGSWSYVGTDSVNPKIGTSNPTMNFGWSVASQNFATALHEIGHLLGMQHEHQNPNAGIVWDADATIRRFKQPPNRWSESMTRHNILRQLDAANLTGGEWDMLSIMHYPIPAGIVREPKSVRQNGVKATRALSAKDIEWVRKAYPPRKRVVEKLYRGKSVPLEIQSGEQKDFELELTATARYRFATWGDADTKLVLFEYDEDEKTYVYLNGDNNSGLDKNALFSERLYKNRKYILRVRMVWSTNVGGSIVFFF